MADSHARREHTVAGKESQAAGAAGGGGEDSATMPTADHRSTPAASPPPSTRPACDVCGCDALYELKCKVVCRNCRSIVRSCADLD